jgi:archaeal flagellar protein FlaI
MGHKLPKLSAKHLPNLSEKKENIFTRLKKMPSLEDKQRKFQIKKNKDIPLLPDVPKEQVDVKYPLLEPYAYAHIKWDPDAMELTYKLEEPQLELNEQRILSLLEEGIKELLNISFLSTSEGETIVEYLEKNIKSLLEELRIKLTKESYLKIMYYIYRDFVGLGKIEPLMNDYFIEDIECNGIGSPIYVVHRKYRNLRTDITFSTGLDLSNFVEKLAQKTGQYISYATPLLDGALPDGSRVNATYTEDISSKGPTFTIRKFTKVPWTPTQLIDLGSVSAEILAYLWLLIEHEQNVMIIGGTGSGKTTMLNGLTFFIQPEARIVSIEDTRELNLEHPNWLPSVARGGVGATDIMGKRSGEVTLFNLLKESFRQNPDYVIVGEVRGEEAYVLFQGMASGHPSFGTMHADSVETMIKRLETPPINLSSSLVETMDVVLIMSHVKIKGKSTRRLREVVEVISVNDQGTAQTNKPFVWDPKADTFIPTSQSYVFQEIVRASGVNYDQLQLEFERRTRLLRGLHKQGVFEFHMVQQIVNDYYKNPDGTLKKYGII